MELRTVAALDAVVRPESLRAVGRLDLFEGLGAGVGGGEGCVGGRVPVLGEDDMGERGSYLMNWSEHGVSVGNRQRATRTKVILDIDDQQDVVESEFHTAFRLSPRLDCLGQRMGERDFSSQCFLPQS